MQVMADSKTQVLEEWVSSYGDALYSWAIYKTSSKETAEDLLQETFLAAVKGVEKFKGESNPKTWLFSIMNNKIAGFHKANFRKKDAGIINPLAEFFTEKGDWKESKRPENWEVDEEHLLDNLEFKEDLSNCMGKLPATWSSALNMKYLSEKKGSQICQELGISDTNYWQVLHRAKLMVRSCIETKWFKNGI
jgi:RNA polymerase sigma factor (sigma-70 family)